MPMIPIYRDGSNGNITPSDVADNIYDGLFVGTGGDVAIEYKNGKQQVIKNVGDGEYIPESVVKVLATGTTATNILGKFLQEQ